MVEDVDEANATSPHEVHNLTLVQDHQQAFIEAASEHSQSSRERDGNGDEMALGGEAAGAAATRKRHRMSVDATGPGRGGSSLANNSASGSRQPDAHSAAHSVPLTSMFPTSKKSVLRAPTLMSQEKFHWDQRAQGHILGAFFYGYVIFQIPGARMAERVGARWILMASTAGSALISLIFPLSTQLNSIHLLMVLRFVMGLCQSAFFPAAYVFFCRWLPESERSVLLPIMFIGSNLGSISTYIMSSYLISSSYGWPSVFYVSGLICLLVTLLWVLLGSNGPDDNWLITSEERDYIQNKINNQNRDDGGELVVTTTTKTQPIKQSCCQLEPAASNQSKAAAAQSPIKRKLSREVVKLNQLNSKQGDAMLLVSNKQIAQVQQMHSKLNKSKSANDLIPAETAAKLLEQRQQIMAANRPAILVVDINNNNNGLEPTTSKAAAAASERKLSWCKVFRSVPVWVLILSMYGNEWSQVVLTYELPTYLNKALKLPIEQNGVINSFFQLSYLLASPIMSSLGACMLERHMFGMRKIHVRKLFQSFATFGQMICFISVPICGPNEGLIIMFMFSAIVLKACANAGDIMVPGDLSPEFAGTIFAFANSIGNTAGVLVPFLAGVIVSDFDRRDSWTPFWLTSATIMGSSGLIFVLLGQTKRQNYAQDAEIANNDDHHHHHKEVVDG